MSYGTYICWEGMAMGEEQEEEQLQQQIYKNLYSL